MSDFAYLIRYLHSSLRWRLFVWLALIVLASVLEGVTLGLFLPIIAGAGSDSPLQQLFTSVFDYLGIRYTLSLAARDHDFVLCSQDGPGRDSGALRGQGDCRSHGQDKGQDG